MEDYFAESPEVCAPTQLIPPLSPGLKIDPPHSASIFEFQWLRDEVIDIKVSLDDILVKEGRGK